LPLGDTVYGVGDIEQQLRRAGKGYVLGVSSAHVFRSWGKRPPVAGTAADIALSNSGKTKRWMGYLTGSDGSSIVIKDEHISNRRNDPERNWGLPE
jgi:SRSO17 transposase